MKILIQYRCDTCDGTGINNKNFEWHGERTKCKKCYGKKVIEEWIDLNEFAEKYLNLKINKIKHEKN